MIKLLLLLLLIVSSFVRAQIDFNEYYTIQSKGSVPEDFTTRTFEKLENDLKEGKKELNRNDAKVFFEGINYAIDDLLHSGLVIFGDDISNYISDIADRILKNNKKLRKELRFYTIKSNSSNAISTDQGIVFVTTGLVSQVTSEAQLAFILSHEISHYMEDHVLNSFTFRKENRRETIERMSVYSREKEFEADRLGLKLYHDAGYSLDEIIPTFDVLMYSYLPFDEIKIDLEYFQNDSTLLPGDLFPESPYEITAVEDDDDSKSSHPNIKKRKETIGAECDKLSNWGDEINPLGDDRFTEIRNIARFESIRNDIIEANYGDALYSVYLLERNFPESIYLKRMKAQTWLGLMMYRNKNRISNTIDRSSSREGYVGSVHFMIHKLKKHELEAMAIRQIYDLVKENPDDKEIGLIWDKTLSTVVFADNFDLSKYALVSFKTASERYLKNMNESKDTTEVEQESTEKLSKYDRIKKKKNVDEPVNFDSTAFHIYLLPDVIQSDLFLSGYEKYKSEFEEEKKSQEEYDALSRSEKLKFNKESENTKLNIGIESVIVVEPFVKSYRSNKVNRVKSEKLEDSYNDIIGEVSQIVGIDIYPVNRLNYAYNGVTAFNERSVLLNMVLQLSQNDDIEPFPVDYQRLKEVENHYGTSNVLFSTVEHYHFTDINASMLYLSAVFFPVGLIYIPVQVLSSNNTAINLIVLDISKAKVVTGTKHQINDNARKHTIGAHMYSVFTELKTAK